MLAQPSGNPRVVPVAGGDRQDSSLGFVDGRVRLPRPLVDLDEDAERHPGGALVPVWKWMVSRESFEQDGGLVGALL